MRLFFALWPSPETAEALAGVACEEVRRLGGKATRAETIHLTLAFLGEQPAERLPEVIAAARKVRTAPFELVIDQLGVWRHNRLLWTGCQSLPGELTVLVEGLRVALHQPAIRFDVEHRRFMPHLTLVRKLPEAAFPPSLPPISPLVWRCERFVLVQSVLSAAGPNYRVVADFALER